MILVIVLALVGVNFIQMSMDGGKVTSDPGFEFYTTDRMGSPYTEKVFSGNKIIMVNLWEPWCSPCVTEMPELQRLYTKYKDDGLLVIGVYSETRMEDRVTRVLTSSNVNYPIIHYTDSFEKFKTGSVPTTVFFDGNGQIIDMKDSTSQSGEPVVIGARTYSDWEAMIKPYLK